MNTRFQWAVALIWFMLVLSYGVWKGNVQSAIGQTRFFTPQGTTVNPLSAKTVKHVAELGSALYYTSPDGTVQTDIYKQEIKTFNWDTFFQVTVFGFGVALLVLIIARMSARFAKESAVNQ